MFKRAPLQFYLAVLFSLLGLILPTHIYYTYSLIELYYVEYNWVWGLKVEIHYYSWGFVSHVYLIYLMYPTYSALFLFFTLSSAVIISTTTFLVILIGEIRNINQRKQYHKERVVYSTIILFMIVVLYICPLLSIFFPISPWSLFLAMFLAYSGNRVAVHLLPIWEESKENYEKRYRKKTLN